MPPLLTDKVFLSFVAPIIAASLLASWSDLSSLQISIAIIGLIILILFFSVVGKLLRDDPDELWRVAIVFGLGSGVLSVILAFLGKIADPFAIMAVAIVASLRGPGYLKEQIEKKKVK